MSTKKKIIISVCLLCVVLAGVIAGVIAAVTQSFSVKNHISFTSEMIEATVTASITNNGVSVQLENNTLTFGQGNEKNQELTLPDQVFNETSEGNPRIDYKISITNNSSDKNIFADFKPWYPNGGGEISLNYTYQIGSEVLADKSLGIIYPGETYDITISVGIYNLYKNTTLSMEFGCNMSYTADRRQTKIEGTHVALVKYPTTFYYGETLNNDYGSNFDTPFVAKEISSDGTILSDLSITKLAIEGSNSLLFDKTGEVTINVSVEYWDSDSSSQKTEVISYKATVLGLPLVGASVTLRNQTTGRTENKSYISVNKIVENWSVDVQYGINYTQDGGTIFKFNFLDGYKGVLVSDKGGSYDGFNTKEVNRIDFVVSNQPVLLNALESVVKGDGVIYELYVIPQDKYDIMKNYYESIKEAAEEEKEDLYKGYLSRYSEFYKQKLIIDVKSKTYVGTYQVHGYSFADGSLTILDERFGTNFEFSTKSYYFGKEQISSTYSRGNGISVKNIDLNKEKLTVNGEEVINPKFVSGVPTSIVINKIQSDGSEATIYASFKGNEVKLTQTSASAVINLENLFADSSVTDTLEIGQNYFNIEVSVGGKVVEYLDLNLYISADEYFAINDGEARWGNALNTELKNASHDMDLGGNTVPALADLIKLEYDDIKSYYLVIPEFFKDAFVGNVHPNSSGSNFYLIRDGISLSIYDSTGAQVTSFDSLAEGLNNFTIIFSYASAPSYKFTWKITIVIESTTAMISAFSFPHGGENQQNYGFIPDGDSGVCGIMLTPDKNIVKTQYISLNTANSDADLFSFFGKHTSNGAFYFQEPVNGNLTADDILGNVKYLAEYCNNGSKNNVITITNEGKLWNYNQFNYPMLAINVTYQDSNGSTVTFKKYLYYIPAWIPNSNAKAYILNSTAYHVVDNELDKEPVNFEYRESEGVYESVRRVTIYRGMPIEFITEDVYATVKAPANLYREEGFEWITACARGATGYFIDGNFGQYDLEFIVTASDKTTTRKYRLQIEYVDEYQQWVTIIVNKGQVNQKEIKTPLDFETMTYGTLTPKGPDDYDEMSMSVRESEVYSAIDSTNNTITLSLEGNGFGVAAYSYTKIYNYKKRLVNVAFTLGNEMIQGVACKQFEFYFSINYGYCYRVTCLILPDSLTITPQFELTVGDADSNKIYNGSLFVDEYDDCSYLPERLTWGYMENKNIKLGAWERETHLFVNIYDDPTSTSSTSQNILVNASLLYYYPIKRKDISNCITSQGGEEMLKFTVSGKGLKYFQPRDKDGTMNLYSVNGDLSNYELSLPLTTEMQITEGYNNASYSSEISFRSTVYDTVFCAVSFYTAMSGKLIETRIYVIIEG